MDNMKIEVSIGEIADKLSILEIKKINIIDETKLININKEYDYLYEVVFLELKINKDDYNRLIEINKKLWKIEDDIRDKERNKEFDDIFIELARSVYITNDERMNIKNIINHNSNSDIKEHKSYKPYI